MFIRITGTSAEKKEQLQLVCSNYCILHDKLTVVLSEESGSAFYRAFGAQGDQNGALEYLYDVDFSSKIVCGLALRLYECVTAFDENVGETTLLVFESVADVDRVALRVQHVLKT